MVKPNDEMKMVTIAEIIEAANTAKTSVFTESPPDNDEELTKKSILAYAAFTINAVAVRNALKKSGIKMDFLDEFLMPIVIDASLSVEVGGKHGEGS